MDDSYIHLVYARNLAQQGRLFFNSSGEHGVGSTSPIWVLLLAGGLKIGLPGTLVAKAIGLLSLFVTCTIVYELTHPIAGRRIAFLAALLTALSGNMLWFSLSGMETTTFVAIALLALLAYRQQRWTWLGILMGLLPLIRPEGVLFAFTVIQIELLRRRRIDRPLITMLVLGVVLSLPWFIYLMARTGYPIPTSGVGKQATTILAIDYVLEDYPALAFLKVFTPPVYALSWIAYLLMFALGGMTLPGPTLNLGALAGALAYQYAWAALVILLAAILPLLWPSLRRVASPGRWKAWLQDNQKRPFLVFLEWLILHNLIFAVFLPIPGTASRYGAINHLALWWGVALGFYFWQGKRRWVRLTWLAALAALAISSTAYWGRVYAANQDHMQLVRIKAARFVDSQPDLQACAVFDIGAVRSFSSVHVIDIGGLIDPELQNFFDAGLLDRYLMDRGADCLIVPGRAGEAQEGWIDFLQVSGLANSELFDLSVMGTFEIDYDRWLLGYLPTNNYQASVVVYRITATDE